MPHSLLLPATEREESELLSGAREGDSECVAELYRRHVAPAERFAAGLTDPSRAADVVADAMMKVFGLLRRGAGPTSGFRSYLFATVRTGVIDAHRKRSRETLVDDVSLVSETWDDGQVGHSVENADVVAAFRSLPERAQKALWLSVVEGRPLDEVGDDLGLNANAVAALTFRARESLRQGYLAQHLGVVARAECERHADQLPKHVRGKLRGRIKRDVEDHLEACHECAIAATTLGSINTRLSALLIPAVLAGALPFFSAASVPSSSGDVGTSSGPGGWQRATAWGSALVAAGALVAGAWWWWPAEDAPVTTDPVEAVGTTPEVVTLEPVRVTDPAAGVGLQASLGHLGSGWAHVDVPVVADERTEVVVAVQGAAQVLVHSDPEHGQWACAEIGGNGQRYRCTVPQGQMASTGLGVDLRGSGTATVRVTVTGPDDTDPSNNSARIDVALR